MNDDDHDNSPLEPSVPTPKMDMLIAVAWKLLLLVSLVCIGYRVVRHLLVTP